MSEDEGGEIAKKRKMSVISKLMIVCVILLILTVGGWLSLFLPTLESDGNEPEPPKTAEEIEREKQKIAAEAEASATWRTFHCNMLHRYYHGDEADLPMAELLGLDAGADEATIKQRCDSLVMAARNMGGWITSQPQQDNFLVCQGFKFELLGDFRLVVRPKAEDLARGELAYALGDGVWKLQDIHAEWTSRIGEYAPLVLQVDDNCIMLAVKRLGRIRAIPGKITRATRP